MESRTSPSRGSFTSMKCETRGQPCLIPNQVIPKRSRQSYVALFLAMFSLAAPLHSQTPDSFNPGASDVVYALACQADGRILVGGAFTALSTGARNRIGRLNPDGTLDTGFYPDASNTVSCLTIQADGKILVGGAFRSEERRVGK